VISRRAAQSELDTDVFNVYRQRYLCRFIRDRFHELLVNHLLLPVHFISENGPSGCRRIYSFDWGAAFWRWTYLRRLAQHHRNTPGWPQTWPQTAVEFVVLHEPPYSSGTHGSNLEVRQALVPLFEQGGVDVVFAGHDHDYERTVPLWQEQTAASDQQGVIYIVSGGGGTPLNNVGHNAWTAFSASRYSFVAADVRGCSLTLTAIDDSGQPFDAVTLDKCPLAWTQVNTPGFGEHEGEYTGQEGFDLTVFGDRLYLGMEGKACEGIWRSKAGVVTPASQEDWEQVVSNGFDGSTDCAVLPPTTDNDHIDSLEPFGGFLYASTAMQTGDKRGSQVWRSATGYPGSWEQVNQPGFGKPSNENFKDMIVFRGQLCGGTGNWGGPSEAPGAQVWCTDGITRDPQDPALLHWRQRNANGFGDLNNIKIWSSAEFNNALYFGVEAQPYGAEPGSIWRCAPR
jgi:hypothetical protein